MDVPVAYTMTSGGIAGVQGGVNEAISIMFSDRYQSVRGTDQTGADARAGCPHENIDADRFPLSSLWCYVRTGSRWSLLRFTTALLEKCGNGTSALIRIDFPPSRLDWGAVRPCCVFPRIQVTVVLKMGLLTKWLFLGSVHAPCKTVDMTKCKRGSVG
jgi:hypothetical protein